MNESINFHVCENAQSDFCCICQDGLGYTEVTNNYQYKHQISVASQNKDNLYDWAGTLLQVVTDSS